MAKFYGKIGYAAEMVETSPGVWTNQIVERSYYGDSTRVVRRLQSTEHLNDDVVVSNEISIVADAFANQNFHAMRYVWYMDSRWKITNVEVQPPRLILTLGGVYNGEAS